MPIYYNIGKLINKKKKDMARRKGIPGLSFSWKRAIGITGVKQKIARKTGIPLTKQGRERKVGAFVLKLLFGKKR